MIVSLHRYSYIEIENEIEDEGLREKTFPDGSCLELNRVAGLKSYQACMRETKQKKKRKRKRGGEKE